MGGLAASSVEWERKGDTRLSTAADSATPDPSKVPEAWVSQPYMSRDQMGLAGHTPQAL